MPRYMLIAYTNTLVKDLETGNRAETLGFTSLAEALEHLIYNGAVYTDWIIITQDGSSGVMVRKRKDHNRIR